jgi:hypothetical protein
MQLRSMPSPQPFSRKRLEGESLHFPFARLRERGLGGEGFCTRLFELRNS